LLELLTAPEAVAFTAALALMLLIGLVEALGLGASGVDLDLGVDVDHGGLLGWLGFGRVPVLVMLIAFLAAFGVIGLAGQQIATALIGQPLTALLAVPAAAIAALPVTGLLGRVLSRVMPHDETTAYDVADLAGRTATITVGVAREGCPARARVLDPHGQAHHVLVEPNDAAASFAEGDTVLLVRREGDIFRAITYDSPRFSIGIDR
jgi:hypothetical protein